MTFSSPIFLFCFFPIVFLGYTIIPNRFLRVRNAFLMLASLLFYGFGEPFAMLLMLLVVFWSYISAILIARGGIYRKIAYPLGIIGNLSVLGIYKYTDFIVENLNTLLRTQIPQPKLALPIGISFFIFQAISYVIDTARKDTSVQRNYFDLLLYISFFPQLVAGPIVRYQTIADALKKRDYTLSKIADGFQRMILGLSKKLLIADTLALVADTVFYAPDAPSLPTAWLAAICYTFQIYFDFSGYSDMAIGMGRIFGFDFPENFNYPYAAHSITEFWKRWHITLTTWFREYLYIPLGGNRNGKFRTICNKWIVFLCTGIWHGANWTFILWGAINGLLMSLEQLLHVPKNPKKCKPLFHIYTVLAVVLAFVMFRADSAAQAFQFYAAMFRFSSLTPAAISECTQLLSPLVCITLLAACICSVPLLRKFTEKYCTAPRCHAIARIGTILLLVLCLLNVAASNYHPFIYFKF